MKCGIIRDLLPNYIDKLTSEDSNAEIEKHLAACKECKAYYQSMSGKTWIENESEEEKQKEIDVLKSFRRMRNKWISILCAIGAGITIAVCMCIWWSYPVPYEKVHVKIQVNDVEAKLDENGMPMSGIVVRSVKGGKEIEYVQFADKTITVDGGTQHFVFVSNKNTVAWQLQYGDVNEVDDNGNIVGYFEGCLRDGTPLSEVSAVYYLDRGINRIKRGADDEEVLELIEKYGHLLWERGTVLP